ncbi:CCA tRNA nucleotidyltransferase [Tropicimonas sp. IMCC34011]|uniref:CCA tRNA nucleotidyltransferase n=1 Tax=Tropicimonas sp. IMCC34011 TaxID=2248759 RepID=UPI000E27F0FA
MSPRLDADWLTDPALLAVTGALEAAGHRALLVGGCVRDALIGRRGGDVDIATDARPEETVQALEAAGLKAVPTGFEHGTVTAVAEGRGFEITTFRRDVETDGRHARVTFSGDPADDAARRDFTMNALYATPEGDVLDPLGTGLDDLAARHVRFVGIASERAREDYLRILRFFRFHAWYADPAGGMDADALDACARHAEGLEGISRERIGSEFMRLLAAPDPGPAVAAMAGCGALGRILPGADPEALPRLVHLGECDPIVRLASLGGEDVADRLRLSKAESRRLRAITDAAREEERPAALGYRLGAADGLSALRLRAALIGTHPAPGSEAAVSGGAAARFPVTARDLMPAWEGRALGERIAELEQRWIDSGFALSREALLASGEG